MVIAEHAKTDSVGGISRGQVELVRINGRIAKETDPAAILYGLKEVTEGHICMHTGFCVPEEVALIERTLGHARFRTGTITGTTNRADAKRTSPYNVRLGGATAKVVESKSGAKASDGVILSAIRIVESPGKDEQFVRKERLFSAYKKVIFEQAASDAKRKHQGDWKKHKEAIEALADRKYEEVKGIIEAALLAATTKDEVYLVDFQREFNSILKKAYGGGGIHEHSADRQALARFFEAESEIRKAAEARGEQFVPFLLVGEDGKASVLQRDGESYRSERGEIVPLEQIFDLLAKRKVHPSGITHVFIHHSGIVAQPENDKLLAVVVADDEHKEYVCKNVSVVDSVLGGNSQALFIKRNGTDLFTRYFYENRCGGVLE